MRLRRRSKPRTRPAVRWLGGLFLCAVIAFAVLPQLGCLPTGGSNGDEAVHRAFENQADEVPVEVEGEIVRLLSDDLEGSRHQRFILRLDSGHTLLISHNIDLAPRVPAELGERVVVSGDYAWNDRGGVVHWTHHDPRGRRSGGWIRHRGQLYR